MTPEGKIQKAIIQLLLIKGYLVIRFNSGGMTLDKRFIRFYTIENTGKSSGLSDIAFMRDSKITFIEVKSKTGKQTDNQKEFEALCKRYKMDYYIFNNWYDVKLFLENIK